jgi:hypothetical protein
MSICFFCEKAEPVNTDDPETYHEAISWVNGPKKDGPVLRTLTGRVAHKTCVDKVIHGQAPDQPELFEDTESFSSKMGHPGGHYG